MVSIPYKGNCMCDMLENSEDIFIYAGIPYKGNCMHVVVHAVEVPVVEHTLQRELHVVYDMLGLSKYVGAIPYKGNCMWPRR